jgi:hypothetical protein
MTRLELFRKAAKEAAKRAEEGAHRVHFWLIVAGGVVFVFFATRFEHYEVAVVLPLLALILLFVLGLFEQAFQICMKHEKAAEDARAAREKAVEDARVAREAAVERLRPKLEILDDGEVDSGQLLSRIRVRSLCDTGIRFGVEIKAIRPPNHNLLLPLPLQITLEKGQLMATLPAKQERTVDVVGRGDIIPGGSHQDIAFFGVGTIVPPVLRDSYRLTICVHADQGTSVEKDFLVDCQAMWSSPRKAATELRRA